MQTIQQKAVALLSMDIKHLTDWLTLFFVATTLTVFHYFTLSLPDYEWLSLTNNSLIYTSSYSRATWTHYLQKATTPSFPFSVECLHKRPRNPSPTADFGELMASSFLPGITALFYAKPLGAWGASQSTDNSIGGSYPIQGIHIGEQNR